MSEEGGLRKLTEYLNQTRRQVRVCPTVCERLVFILLSCNAWIYVFEIDFYFHTTILFHFGVIQFYLSKICIPTHHASLCVARRRLKPPLTH
jgi:hypothetical protein